MRKAEHPTPGVEAPSAKRILVVEDDPAMARVLHDLLTMEGYTVSQAATGAVAVAQAKEQRPNLIVLDLTLPDVSGFELCGELGREANGALVILTARGQKADKLKGLNLGAADYITKPFDTEELLARIRAVLRRARQSVQVLELGAVLVDLQSQRVLSKTGGAVTLTRRECDVLRYLGERRDKVVHRDELLREVWGYPDAPLTRSVDSAVARIRKKIEPDPHRPLFIHTVHGDGYCLTSSADRNGPKSK